MVLGCLQAPDYAWNRFSDWPRISLGFPRGWDDIRGQGEPVALKTSLGWVLARPVKGKTLSAAVYTCCMNFATKWNVKQKEINTNLHKLWDLDSLGIGQGEPVHETVLHSITFIGVRYYVVLPWKLGHKNLPSKCNIWLLELNNQI